jgi:hypothetical protein
MLSNKVDKVIESVSVERNCVRQGIELALVARGRDERVPRDSGKTEADGDTPNAEIGELRK